MEVEKSPAKSNTLFKTEDIAHVSFEIYKPICSVICIAFLIAVAGVRIIVLAEKESYTL